MSATTPEQPPVPLPALRQDVVITLPSREQYRGRVSKVSAEEVVIVLMLDTRRALALGDASPMVVEFPGPRGLVRLEGRGTVATHDVVRFHHDGADVVQRRDFVRVHAVRPLELARVRPDGEPGPWTETLTVNVSGNGLLAAGPDTLRVGDTVLFRVSLHDADPPVAGRGRVARVADGGQPGINIEEIDRDARRHLVRFIFEQERIARQRTRDGEL
ncbi:MAG TPA: PilZ domain-containing protein [Conexibacter sp.]|nr:PilZ domain-containing protein [Conexibacter sp.]